MVSEEERRQEEVQTAEDYRLQRLEADHRKNGTGNVSLREQQRAAITSNKDRTIANLVARGATPEQAVNAYETILARFDATEETAPFDDVISRPTVKNALDRIEQACRILGVKTRNGVVFGAVPERDVSAGQFRVLETDVSILQYSFNLFPFCIYVSSLIAAAMPYDERPSGFYFSLDAKQLVRTMHEKNLFERWYNLVLDFAVEGRPTLQLEDLPAVAGQAQVGIIDAMIMFVMAHEYAHHALDHHSAQRDDPKQIEYEADTLARRIANVLKLDVMPINVFAASGVGAAAVLGTLELVRRARAVLQAGLEAVDQPSSTHPSFQQRMDNLCASDAAVPNKPPLTPGVAWSMRLQMIALIEAIWREIHPALLALHYLGTTIPKQESDASGWLPLDF